MSGFRKFKNRAIAKAIGIVPGLGDFFASRYEPVRGDSAPWTQLGKPLSECRVALVTTAGLHHRDDRPFNMSDKDGDPTIRFLDLSRPAESIMITHDYYDHTDADSDINVVFPMDRLRELSAEGIVGQVSDAACSFMGHITGPHIETLVKKEAPKAADRLLADGVDVAVFTPG